MGTFQQMVDDQNTKIAHHSKCITVSCLQVDDDHIIVNSKSVRWDMNDNWIAKEALSIVEAKFFNEFLDTTKRVRSNRLQATYTI